MPALMNEITTVVDAMFTREHETLSAPATSSLWMHAVPHLHPRYGGVSAVIPRLTTALWTFANVQSEIAAFCEEEPGECDEHSAVCTVEHWPGSQRRWMRESSCALQLRKRVRDVDGLHVHGVWQVSARAAAAAARAGGKPYLLSAHGMLDGWALKQKRFKKALYAAVVERETVRNASCLHALTTAEAADYRRFGAKQPIAVIPNGVDVPGHASPAAFHAAFPETRNRRVILFVGRIHRKKGLDHLVDAWACITDQFPDALLVIAGPDSDGLTKGLRGRARRWGISDRVVFTGMLNESMKWSALASSYGFVLPSFAEGFSVAALEAVGMGVPSILSHQCHFPQIAEEGYGWTIRPKSEEIAAALFELLSLDLAAIRQIRQRGRALITNSYRWEDVARQMGSVYAWVRGGERPKNVQILEV